MRAATLIHELSAGGTGSLPRNVFRYVLQTSAVHQLLLLALTVAMCRSASALISACGRFPRVMTGPSG